MKLRGRQDSVPSEAMIRDESAELSERSCGPVLSADNPIHDSNEHSVSVAEQLFLLRCLGDIVDNR